MNKTELRRKMRIIRKNITPTEREKKSGIIMQKIISSKEYLNCSEVFSYINYGTEVITENLLIYALQEGKTTALPYITKTEGKMVFIKISSLNSLVKNSYGIKEPIFDEKNIIIPSSNSLFIVPGLAFTAEGWRLGYGGGYYDRYLSKYITLSNLGVCFKEQLTENVPVNEYDIKLNKIITD